MKTYYFFASLLFVAGALCSCNEVAEQSATDAADGTATTRAYGDKTPKLVTYVETNDVNPLNAGDWLLSDGEPAIDIVELFASNIHSTTVDGVEQPTLYFNDKMTNIFENGGAAKYVKGLQDKGIKVLLTVLGDWQHIGVANLNDTQVEQFTTILAYAVERYGLDGIGFDDEYADYYSTNTTSYSNIITGLRAKMPADKLITVFYWGAVNTISAEAWAAVDYSYHGYFSPTYYYSPAPSPLTDAQWSPISVQLGQSYTATRLATLSANASQAAADGYGAIMTFNLRTTSDVNPQPVFGAIARGAWGETVTLATEPSDAGNRPQDWEFVPTGFTITYANATGADPLPPVAR